MTGPVAIAARRVKWEQRMFWRNPPAAAFTFAFPLMFLVVFNAINGNSRVRLPGGSVRFAQYYVPGIVAFGIISACYTNLAITLVFRRELGVLKRTRGTPVSPGAYLFGLVGNSLVIALILSALTTVAGVVLYGVQFPGRYLGLAVTIAAGAFCFSCLGMAVSALVPNEDAGPAIVNFAIFPLLFISGTFGAVDDGSGLARLAGLFPIRHLNQLMIAVFSPFTHGTGIVLSDVLVIVGWGLAGLVLAVTRFRWEPRQARS
ncbi:MAG TPA: ABC transporter permease [Acidimicrobiales bacterium]|nr:ABC transporter permease [Acidimicrobiales bacterium]